MGSRARPMDSKIHPNARQIKRQYSEIDLHILINTIPFFENEDCKIENEDLIQKTQSNRNDSFSERIKTVDHLGRPMIILTATTAAKRNSAVGLFRQCNGDPTLTVAKRAAIAVLSHPTVSCHIGSSRSDVGVSFQGGCIIKHF
jgi:hypothetical protein